jgi:hypothetical protein
MIRGSSPSRSWEPPCPPPRPDRLRVPPSRYQAPPPPEAKRPRREANHPHPSSSEIKNAWSHTSTPQHTFMAWCSAKAQGHLHHYLYLPTFISLSVTGILTLLVKFCFRDSHSPFIHSTRITMQVQ